MSAGSGPVIAGNSHVVALAAADPPPGLDATVVALGNGRHETEAFSRRRGEEVMLEVEQYAASLRRATGHDAIAAGREWGLLQVNHHARVFRDPTWLTWEPAGVVGGVDPGRVPVSRGLVEAAMAHDQAGVRRLFEDLLDAGVPFFAISAPPVRRDHPAIGRGVRPEVVLEIDRIGRSVWATWLTERGVALVDPPVESWAADGFLEERFASDAVRGGSRDRTHANPAYGTLMLAAIAQHLSP